ncbi:hypothetical protein AJ79_03699 [Helicocarpus griseus UAMH5409]|uniref:Uncharacterized protein n=1 Tax=Helicocarpus griseus UAMH5409 TaxID=1447875 RepID=A0A2B7XWP2_9EURO|nr:hypothetical protein AJ79_03699 [Helicocarpus griseus UAMH5409]
MATVNGNITSINRSNSSSGNNNPRFITICSATFDPATLAACPSYNVHPEVVDAHPCSDHWTMLADARLFFGLPGALESVQSDEEGVGGMNGYDSLLKDRLDVLRERFCWKGDGNGRAGSGSDVNGDVNGVSIDDQSQSRDQSQNQSRSETRRRVPRKPPPAMTEAKGGRTFIDILCDWMGGFRDGI